MFDQEREFSKCHPQATVRSEVTRNNKLANVASLSLLEFELVLYSTYAW